jgi:hypothetical protein
MLQHSSHTVDFFNTILTVNADPNINLVGLLGEGAVRYINYTLLPVRYELNRYTRQMIRPVIVVFVADKFALRYVFL